MPAAAVASARQDDWWGAPEPCQNSNPERILKFLGLFYRDGILFAYFNAAFTAETFFSIHGNGFTVLHLKYLDRANVYAFFTSCTFSSSTVGVKAITDFSFLEILKEGDRITCCFQLRRNVIIPIKKPRQALMHFLRQQNIKKI